MQQKNVSGLTYGKIIAFSSIFSSTL